MTSTIVLLGKLLLTTIMNTGEKRPRGCSKGSKNLVTAGAVGRPRKDGKPPQKREVKKLASSSASDGVLTCFLFIYILI